MSVVNVVLNIAADYSKYPGPRFEEDGPFSGQRFRDELLVPAMVKAKQEGAQVVVNLDGARGYTASFLEEAFGGLIRERGYHLADVNRLLIIQSDDRRVKYWCEKIRQYMESAAANEAGR